jgi:rhodanese-related sulfurtransferase
VTVDQLLEAARRRLQRVTAAEARAAMGRGAVLVDIRSESQQARDGLLPGAIVIPRNVLEWRADPACEHHDPRLGRRQGRLMLICAQGYQSSLAAATLHDLGITDATDVIDGVEGWIEAELPVEQPEA